jgi:hypothetical protein
MSAQKELGSLGEYNVAFDDVFVADSQMFRF